MYEFFSEDALKLPIINSVGFAENKIFTRYGPSKRNFYIIHYIISGRGTYNGKNLTVVPANRVDINIPSDATEVKIFLWKDLSGCKPLAQESVATLKVE